MNRSHVVWVAISLGVLEGCIATVDDASVLTDELEVGLASEALTGDIVDASGKVTVRIKTCAWTSPAQHPVATCSIDTDFVLVGGGAEIEADGEPGALLSGSWPDEGFTTWSATSRDHGGLFYSHRLRAYAIGLKLAGVSSVELRQSLILVRRASSSAQHPSTTAELPSGYTLIGGGARALAQLQGQLLTESKPDSFQWVASSKDHGGKFRDVGSVQAFAIGIKEVIPNFGTLSVTVNSAYTNAPTSYSRTSIQPPDGWALTSIGGAATYDGPGRLLSDLIPFFDVPADTRQGAWVSSKDHLLRDSGDTYAYTIAVQAPSP